jgi:hypothetical protein
MTAWPDLRRALVVAVLLAGCASGTSSEVPSPPRIATAPVRPSSEEQATLNTQLIDAARKDDVVTAAC